MSEEDIGNIELEDLEEQETIDKYGKTLNPSLIPQDPVQADFCWYDPEKDEKGIITKNMSLSFLEERDLNWIYMSVDLINILDMININLKTQYAKEGKDINKLDCLVNARKDIQIELDTMLTAKRSIRGRTAILSRTATHRFEQQPTSREYGEQEKQPGQKKGLRKLWPL